MASQKIKTWMIFSAHFSTLDYQRRDEIGTFDSAVAACAEARSRSAGSNIVCKARQVTISRSVYDQLENVSSADVLTGYVPAQP